MGGGRKPGKKNGRVGQEGDRETEGGRTGRKQTGWKVWNEEHRK